MKLAHELKHPQSTKVVVLLEAGTDQMIGKIIANYSNNPNGSVVTTTLYTIGFPSQTTTAGGGGYDKFADCLSRLKWDDETMPYNGRYQWFAERGVTYLDAL